MKQEQQESTALPFMPKSKITFFPVVSKFIDQIISEIEVIDDERKMMLSEIADYISKKIKSAGSANLLMVCLHNSRRSHFAQVWAQVAAHYFGLENFKSYSGGGEATKVHENTIAAFEFAGLLCKKESNACIATFSENVEPIHLFSKLFDDKANPKNNFGAVLVCVNDAQACPYIPDADVRIGLPYKDPKFADGRDNEIEAYDACSKEIAREMFWLMNHVAEKIF